MARSLNQQMDLFERVDPVEIPDLDTPPFSPELLAESKEKVEKAPLDFVEGSITAPFVAAGDIVDLGAAAPPLSDKQMMMPGAVQYSAIEQLFETLSNQGVSRDSAVKLINENTPVNLEGSPAEFIGEMAGVTATGVAKAVSGLAKIASKYGDDAGKYLSEIGGELGEMFNRSTPGGDDFDGMAPATVADTSPVAAQTDQAFDAAPTMPDTSVSPIMIGTGTGAGRQAADDYDAMKASNPDMDEAELFAQTGVYKGPDGQHRLEVDTTDAKLAVDVQNLIPGDAIPLGSLLDFEDLFSAYEKSFYDNVNLDFKTPESLRNVEVYIVDDPDFNGTYSYTSGNIQINADLVKKPEKFRSTLLHEVQHAVQHREGFVSGSSSEAFISSSAKALDPNESVGVINSMDDLVKLSDQNKKDRVKLNNNNDVILKNHIEGVLGSPSLTPNVKYEQVDELSTNTITDVILAALQREGVSIEDIKGGVADNAFKSKNIRSFLQELKDVNKKNNPTERQQSRLDDIDYAINFIDKLGAAGNADEVLRKTIVPKVLNAAEGAHLRQVEAVADLSYYRKYGEVEARLIQERDARRAQLRDMGFDRGEIFSILREEFPPENYTVPLEVMTAANVDVSNLKQATLRRPGNKGEPAFVLPESDVLLEGAERKPEGLGVADDVATEKLTPPENVIQGANETGFSRAVYHSTGDAANLRVPKMVPEARDADIGFHVGTAGAANDRIIHYQVLGSMERSRDDAVQKGFSGTPIQDDIDKAFKGKSVMPLYLSDDLKSARIIDLNQFKQPQNWLEELTNPYVSNTELGYFNIPPNTEMPSIELPTARGTMRTLHMSPQAFAEGVSDDVWRSAVEAANNFNNRTDFDPRSSLEDKTEWFEAVQKIATDNGYDSFVYKNKKEGSGQDSYMLLDPRQVKSFTSKDFDPNNPDITMAEGGVVPMDRQMDMFADGGLEQDGRTNDPVSGNEVPPGSTQEEVRDDIPAQLSEGEFVFPADVVRFIGLEKLMQMRQEAKMGLKMMEEMGQMGNSDEASMPDDLPFDINDLDMDDAPEYNVGGFVPGQGFPSIPPGIAPPNQQVANQQFGIAGYTPSAQPTTGYYQAPFTQYGQQQFMQPATPVAQAPVPTMKEYEIPQFGEFVGGEFGAYDELREYRNEAGNVVMVPFKDGSPISPIPEGYTFYDPEETETEEVVTTPTTPQTTQTSPDDDGDSTNDETFATTDVTGIGYNRSKLTEELRDVISEFGTGLGTLGETFNIYGGIARDLSKDPKAKDSSLTSGALGGVLDAFRGNADPNNPVTFSDPSRMGSKKGQYADTTRLHEMSRSKQVQIATVARTVVGDLRKIFVDDEGKAKKTSEVDKGLSGLLKSLGISTSVNTPKGTVFKSRTTLVREIANAQAANLIEEQRKADERAAAAQKTFMDRIMAPESPGSDDGGYTDFGVDSDFASDYAATYEGYGAEDFDYGYMNTGGLVGRKKNKPKKKMKRGGLASKK